MAEILTFKASDLKAESLKARGCVLVDFWAAWCGPCRMLAPSVDALAEEFAGRLTVGKVNIDEEGDAAAAMGIASIPTLVIFKDGAEVERMIGAVPKPQLKAFIERNI